ncbi:MAG: ABC transporter substrate-binding protein [Chloroflexota bacterium]
MLNRKFNALIVPLLLLLMACQPIDMTALDSANTSSDAGQAGDDAMMTQEITHELGTTTIEGVPERIVVLEYSFADNLGTLGIAPVGYAVDAPPAYLSAFTEDVGATAVGKRAEPSLEAIAALSPDLIIGDQRRHTEIYDKLSEIAPTVIFNSLRGSYQDQLDTFEIIAGILGKEDEAAALLSTYEETFAATTTEANPDAGEFIIGVLWSGGYTAHSNESFMGSFLESLGRTNALSPLEGETQYLLELEGLATVNPSSIIILCNPGDQGVLDELQAQPVWQNIDAVQNGQIYLFDRNLWSKGRGLTAFETILTDAVDSGLLAETASSNTTTCP